MESCLYKTSKLYKATVLNHPSKACKSPYLADVKVFENEKDELILEENVMAHTPALGCCGLIKPNSLVYCTKSNSEKSKSKFIINHVFLKEEKVTIGVNPMLANPIVKQLLLANKFKGLKNIKNLKQEVTKGDSRFDFSFELKNGKTVFLEVKNVPIADVVDVEEKQRKKLDLTQYDFTKKIAVFPNGYRKTVKDPISPRAIKHTEHLAKLVKEGEGKVLSVIVFLIQRTDVVKFKPSVVDPIYQKALYDAVDFGVKVIPVCVEWRKSECFFFRFVPLVGRDEE